MENVMEGHLIAKARLLHQMHGRAREITNAKAITIKNRRASDWLAGSG
jgi:hypothetical protein